MITSNMTGMALPPGVEDITGDFLALIDASAPGLVEGLYLHGSIGFGEYFPGESDVDFVAVLATRPGAAEVSALAAAHATLYAAHPQPYFDGFHILREDLTRPPDRCPEVPGMFQGSFFPAGHSYDISLVTWHELARHGVQVRGPDLAEISIWTDDAALRAFSHANLSSYWAAEAAALTEQPEWAIKPLATQWCVLGVSRLHHLLATAALTSKSGAGRYALTTFGPQWHPIISEALRIRERPGEPSQYDGDLARRARDTTAFTTMAIEAALALGP